MRVYASMSICLSVCLFLCVPVRACVCVSVCVPFYCNVTDPSSMTPRVHREVPELVGAVPRSNADIAGRSTKDSARCGSVSTTPPAHLHATPFGCADLHVHCMGMTPEEGFDV